MLFRLVCDRTTKTNAEIAHHRLTARVYVQQCVQSQIWNKLDRPEPIFSIDHFHNEETIAFLVVLVEKLLLLTTLQEHLKLSQLPKLGALRDIILGPSHHWNCQQQVLQLAFLCENTFVEASAFGHNGDRSQSQEKCRIGQQSWTSERSRARRAEAGSRP